MSKLEKWLQFSSHKLIIQSVRIKNENIRPMLNYNENFILFWSVLLLTMTTLLEWRVANAFRASNKVFTLEKK